MALPVTKGVVTVLPPPEGYDVDFENPARYGDVTCYVITGIGIVIAFLFMSQRLYVNFIIRRSVRLDDILLIIAWLFSLAIQVLIVRGFAAQYLGVHAWEIPFTKFQEYYLFAVYIHTIVYAPPTALAKLVLLLFYLQLQNRAKWFQYATYFTMFVNVAGSTGVFFSSIFACKPIAMGWDLTIIDGKCIDRPAMYEATAALGVIVDCLIIAIPIPMVVHLHMSKAKKAGLILMFVLGSVTVVTSFVRLILLLKHIKDADSTWVGGPINMWVCIEANLLIMCASLPTLRMFLRTVAPGLISSTNKSKPYKSTPSGNITIGGGVSSRSNRGGRKSQRTHDNDPEFMMETLVGQDGAKDGGWSHSREMDEEQQVGSDDGDSQKAIVRGEERGPGMQTTHVQYPIGRGL